MVQFVFGLVVDEENFPIKSKVHNDPVKQFFDDYVSPILGTKFTHGLYAKVMEVKQVVVHFSFALLFRVCCKKTANKNTKCEQINVTKKTAK